VQTHLEKLESLDFDRVELEWSAPSAGHASEEEKRA
jgi:hypothetical protein